MCSICGKDASVSKVGGYQKCQYCNTYIAAVIPPTKDLQNVLEDHASAFIIGGPEHTVYSQANLERLHVLKKFARSIQNILDVGCGNGSFVEYLISEGYRSFGYDKSKKIQKYLSGKKIPMYRDLRDMPNHHFDVITCFDVIEHTTDPHILIQSIKKKLKKNGVLMMTTPNARGFSSLILSQKWWVFGPTAHFILFSPRSLQLFLSRMGFELLDIRTDILTPWFTPTEKFMSRFLNKCVYLATLPFQKFLFAHSLGDNIQIVARSSRARV
jgi:SAM-dependent methyltransferase